MSERPIVLTLDDTPVPPALQEGWAHESVSSADLPGRLAALEGRAVLVVTPAQAEDAARVLGAGSPDDTPESAPVDGIEVGQWAPPGGAPAEPEGTPDAGPAPGWQQGLSAMEANLDVDRSPALPESFGRIAPVREVLEQAGQRGLVETAAGETYVACGYPDLLRAGSKVLLARETAGRPELIALHRHPVPVGVVGTRRTDGYLPGDDWDPDPIAADRTGQPLPAWGTLFAVEGDAVYVERAGKVSRWDGRKEVACGSPTQAMATLVLRWSQR